MNTPKLYGSADLVTWYDCGELPEGTTRVLRNEGSTPTLVALSSIPGGEPGTSSLYYSLDYGATWTNVPLPFAIANYKFRGSEHINGNFLVWLCSGWGSVEPETVYENYIGISNDGIHWTFTLISITGCSDAKFFLRNNMLSCLVATDHTGNSADYQNSYMNSWDGIDWSVFTIYGIDEGILLQTGDEKVAANDSYIMAIGTNGYAYYTSNGTAWSTYDTGEMNNLNCILANGNFNVANNDGEAIVTRRYADDDVSVQTTNDLTQFDGVPYLNGSFFYCLQVCGIINGAQNVIYKIDPINIGTSDPWVIASTGIPSGIVLQKLLHQ